MQTRRRRSGEAIGPTQEHHVIERVQGGNTIRVGRDGGRSNARTRGSSCIRTLNKARGCHLYPHGIRFDVGGGGGGAVVNLATVIAAGVNAGANCLRSARGVPVTGHTAVAIDEAVTR